MVTKETDMDVIPFVNRTISDISFFRDRPQYFASAEMKQGQSVILVLA